MTDYHVLSASALKALACVFMLIDHVGMRLFPGISLLRIVGRLAYPIFAFFIAEGCRYTRNKTKRFLTVFVLGAACELAYICYTGIYYGGILITFSLSIFLIYCLQSVKKQLCAENVICCALSLVGLGFAVLLVYSFVGLVGVDYGFAGVMVSVLTALPDYKSGEAPVWLKKWDCLGTKLLCFTVGLMLVIIQCGVNSVQIYSLFAVPLLALYNGQRGKHGFKYGFYIFYPAHLLIIELLGLIL